MLRALIQCRHCEPSRNLSARAVLLDREIEVREHLINDDRRPMDDKPMIVLTQTIVFMKSRTRFVRLSYKRTTTMEVFWRLG